MIQSDNSTAAFQALIAQKPANMQADTENKQSSQLPKPQQAETQTTTAHPVNSQQIKDEFVKAKKSNGLFRKLYDALKNKTGFGIGSKAVEADIAKFEKQEISEKEVKEKLDKYKNSQKNSVQCAGDVAAAATTISAYMLADKGIKYYGAMQKLDALPLNIGKALKEMSEHNKVMGNMLKAFEGIAKSKTKATLFMLPALGILGGVTKLAVTKFERLGSKEFKVNKKDFKDKKEYKAEKKKANAAKFKEDFKNLWTGAVNGMLAPVTALFGGIVGVPAYLAATFGLRHATNKPSDPTTENTTETKKSSIKQTLKDNAILSSITALAVAIPTWKKVRYNKVLSANMEKVVNKLTNVQLKKPDLASTKTVYNELEDLMLDSEPIRRILKLSDAYDSRVTTSDIIGALTDENIFAVKFLQIKNSDIMFGGNNYRTITEALRENCPTTRTIEEAQEHINKMWGSAEFTISKLLGTGTVAETYLVKDSTGKEVCVKILKKGINSGKIAKDKEKFRQLVIGNTPLDKLTENQKYLLKNIDDLADGIAKEVDFKTEMNSALELKNYSRVANVVVPIAAKDGIYVMEKAPGISVKTLMDYCQLNRLISYYERELAKNEGFDCYYEKRLTELREELKALLAKSPDFEAFKITPAQVKNLLKTYIDVQVEQFSKLNKNGKVIHADIHPGNIFIDLKALQTGKGKLFTLIDTGNTIKLSKEDAKASLKIIGLIKNGNVKDLTKVALQDAKLPEGLTYEQALKQVEADLTKYFFDSETKISSMNIDTFFALTDNILRKYNIIPNSTQLNLNKAKISAQNSFNNLTESFFSKKYGELDLNSNVQRAATIARALTDLGEIGVQLKTRHTLQETRNLSQMSLKEAFEFLSNKNNLKTNSEDYLTYKLKQNMPEPQKTIEEIMRENDL